MVQTKLIDCKMKEIYYTPSRVEEDTEVTEYRTVFWNCMEVYALQNMNLVHVKRA